MLQYKVSGMTCGHCVSAVTKAIQSTYPNAEVDVDLAQQTVTVSLDQNLQEVASLIAEAGYSVHDAKIT